MLSEDTISREIKSNKLITKRLLSKTNNIPNWAKRFINTSHVYIVEESVVDVRNKTLITYTRNVGFTKVMVCERSFLVTQLHKMISRVSQKKLYTDKVKTIHQKLLQPGMLGLTLKFVVSVELYVHLDMKGN